MPYLYRLGSHLPHSRYWWTGGKHRNRAPPFPPNVLLLNILKSLLRNPPTLHRGRGGRVSGHLGWCKHQVSDARGARGAAFNLTDISNVTQLFSLVVFSPLLHSFCGETFHLACHFPCLSTSPLSLLICFLSFVPLRPLPHSSHIMPLSGGARASQTQL